MAGYNWAMGMSNNAVAAYDSGERPLSRWTKSAILERATDVLVDSLEFDGSYAEACGEVSQLARFPLWFLKRELLRESSWHHTGKFFNATTFYDIEEDDVLYMLLHLDEVQEGYARELEYKRIVRKAEKAYADAGMKFVAGHAVWSLVHRGSISSALEADICNPSVSQDLLWRLSVKRVAVL